MSNGLSQKRLSVPKQEEANRFFGGDRWRIAWQDGVCKSGGREFEAGGRFEMDTSSPWEPLVESWERIKLCRNWYVLI